MNKCIWEKVYSAIDNSMPDGIGINDLLNKLKISKQSIYTAVHMINKEKKNLKGIKNYQYVYYTFDRGTVTAVKKYAPRENNHQSESSTIGNIIPKHLLKVINDLPEHDRADFNDLLKKSLFYGKSAIALLEANQYTNNLMEGL